MLLCNLQLQIMTSALFYSLNIRKLPQPAPNSLFLTFKKLWYFYLTYLSPRHPVNVFGFKKKKKKIDVLTCLFNHFVWGGVYLTSVSLTVWLGDSLSTINLKTNKLTHEQEGPYGRYLFIYFQTIHILNTSIITNVFLCPSLEILLLYLHSTFYSYMDMSLWSSG